MPSITDLFMNPQFQALSPREKEEAIQKFNTATLNLNSKKTSVEYTDPEMIRKEQNSASDAKTVSKYPFLKPFIGQGSIADPEGEFARRGKGAAIGTMTGGPIGGALGAAFPPETAGDYATQFLGGPIASKGAGVINKMAPGLKKVVASGLMGGGMTALQHGISEGTNMAGNAMGMQNAPSRDLGMTGMAIGSALPALGTHFASNKVANNPTVKTNEFVNEQLGTNTPLSQVSNIADRPTDPRLGGVMAAAENPAMVQNRIDRMGLEVKQQDLGVMQKKKDEAVALLKSQIAGREVQRKKTIADKIRSFAGVTIDPADISKSDEMRVEQILQQESDLVTKRAAYKEAGLLGADKDTKVDLLSEITGAELSLLQKRAEIVQEKAIEKVAKAAAGSAPDPTKLQLANIDTSKAVARKAITQQMGEKKKIATGQEYLKQSISNLKEQAGLMQEAMNPILRKIAWDNPDPAKLIEGFLQDGTPDAIKAFKSHLQAQPNGAAHVKAFQDGMLQEFFKRAFDPKTKTLSNAQELFAPDKAFSAQKIEALYGPDKVTTFRQVFDDIQKVTAESNNTSSIAKHTVSHFFGWSLPMAFMYSRGTPAHLAAGGVAAAAGLSAIAWPKFINSMLKNPKYADRFHQWATSDVTQRNLKNWPTLAQFFDENSEPVNDVLNDTAN